MNVLVVQHLVTLTEATRIMRFFKQKKHASHGYFFELQDLGAPMAAVIKLPGLEPYGAKGHNRYPRPSWLKEDAYILRVHREVPNR